MPVSTHLRIPGDRLRDLKLVGRFMYLQVKLRPETNFVIHVDVVAVDDLPKCVALKSRPLLKTASHPSATFLPGPCPVRSSSPASRQRTPRAARRPSASA